MPITVPAVRETLASWFTRLLVCTVSAVRKFWLYGLRNYRFVQFQPSEELQFLVLFNSVRTVLAFRQTLISCFLGLCNSPFLLSQLSENFAFLGYATTHLYNISCQRTLRALFVQFSWSKPSLLTLFQQSDKLCLLILIVAVIVFNDFGLNQNIFQKYKIKTNCKVDEHSDQP